MSSADNHNTSWSDADLQRYLKGELSPREMHALEKAALDDPFLSDALEGLATPHPENDLSELKARLSARVEEKERRAPVIWFRRPGFRVAAAVILLVGIGITTWYTLGDKKTRDEAPSLVKRESLPETKPATTQPPAAATTPPADNAVAVNTHRAKRREPRLEEAKKEDDAAAAKPIEAAPANPTTRDLAKDSASPAATDKSTASEGFVPATASGIATTPTPPVEMKLRRATLRAVTLHRAPLNFSGQVVDANDRPLAGASLYLKGTNNIGTTTDANGKFNFRIPPHDTAGQMTVALIGYQQTDFALNSNAPTNNVIRLQEAKASLDEVIVTGYAAQRKETRAIAASDNGDKGDSLWLKVYPLSGRLAYLQYLDSARKSLSVDTTIHGTESISFQVDQKGQITDFKIEQSLSPVHDAGVIQMITAGPAWKLLHGKKQRAVVTIRFP